MRIKEIYIGVLFFILTCCQSSLEKSSNIVNDSLTTQKRISGDSINFSDLFKINPNLKFPYNSDSASTQYGNAIDISGLRSKKIFDLPFKKFETVIGEDYTIDDSNLPDSTFSLADTNFVASWIIISKQPDFVLIENTDNNTGYTYLVTVTYSLSVIDAIRSLYYEGNSQYNAGRNVTIFPDLSLAIHGYYSVLEDEKRQVFNSVKSTTFWYIDEKGYFKRK